MNKKEVYSLLIRYIILIILGIPNLFIFYFVFTPLTVEPTFFILSLIDPNAYILQDAPNTIFFKGYFASIIPACVAGAAYYLLLILNLTTPMEIRKRMVSILFLFGSFLVINLARITVFALLLFKGFQYFDITHTATWYFGSTVMVILIWFSNVLIFRIKSIPIYTDIKRIYHDMKAPKANNSYKQN